MPPSPLSGKYLSREAQAKTNGLWASAADEATVFKQPNSLGSVGKCVRKIGMRRWAMMSGEGERGTLISLLHTYATQALFSDTDIYTLAKQLGTSVRMLELHYSKLTATMTARTLA